ncbi:hypothetical protein N9Z65_00830 [bacterium]|nr:hypothetical protein [bacterium]
MKKDKYLVIVSYNGREERIVVSADSRPGAENVVYEKKKHLFDHDAIHGKETIRIKSTRRMS